MHPVSRDDETAWFFDGLRSGVFLLPQRRSDGAYLDPRAVPVAGEPVDHVPASGFGTVVSWAVPAESGSVLGIVALDEGPWWWCRLDGVDPGADLLGQRMELGFVPSGPDADDEIVPVFRPVRAATAGE